MIIVTHTVYCWLLLQIYLCSRDTHTQWGSGRWCYLCCCWPVRSLRPTQGTSCVRSVRTPAPGPRRSRATRRSPAGRDGTEPAARTGAPPGDWATWPESCGRRGWWRGGWGRRTAAGDSPPRTGCSRWCGSGPSAAGSCIHTWLRCCAAAAGADGIAAATRPSPSAPAATDWPRLERHAFITRL